MTNKHELSNLRLSTSGPQKVAYKGKALLEDSHFNKGTAFTERERDIFELHGLLPSAVQTLDEQAKRAYQQFQKRYDDLAKNAFMTSLKEQNEVLYYRIINDHLKEMFPIIYTPTEGEAISQYSRLFRKPEGCFLDIANQGRIEQSLKQHSPSSEIDVIVVSDGEQILGIGDQGVGAILISTAKLAIYTICAGIHPTRTLPVVLDCGTNNEKLLNDDLYLGLHRNRARGEEYDRFVDRFMVAAKKTYPNAYIHFEDFGLGNARRLLDKYTSKVACFNDDVQGTGSVTLASIMAALKINKVPWEEARIVCFGAGTAGTGIADQIRDAISVETSKSVEEARRQIWCIDKPGLLLKSMEQELTSAQYEYARNDDDWKGKDCKSFLEVIKQIKPHILIGTSTQPGAFTKEICEEMAKHVERPIIFPLSNPTRLHEAKPADIFEWTKGKALVATGSPFAPVEYNGKKYDVAECNNSVCFPGIGLGVILSGARLLPPPLLVAATKAIAEEAPILKDPTKGLCPDIDHARQVSVKIAAAVVKAAMKANLNQVEGIPENDQELEKWIVEQMWSPEYRDLELKDRN